MNADTVEQWLFPACQLSVRGVRTMGEDHKILGSLESALGGDGWTSVQRRRNRRGSMERAPPGSLVCSTRTEELGNTQGEVKGSRMARKGTARSAAFIIVGRIIAIHDDPTNFDAYRGAPRITAVVVDEATKLKTRKDGEVSDSKVTVSQAFAAHGNSPCLEVHGSPGFDPHQVTGRESCVADGLKMCVGQDLQSIMPKSKSRKPGWKVQKVAGEVERRKNTGWFPVFAELRRGKSFEAHRLRETLESEIARWRKVNQINARCA
ncbi:hypothetical protein C8R43DRAFT_954985 [Mycena crocata]|nr:hypothetical protein C8R43DRAFT_954985 [Mycena crocata]